MEFVKFIKENPTFFWLIPAAMSITSSYLVPEEYKLIASLFYALFILLFMRGMNLSMEKSRRTMEESGTNFIAQSISSMGGGKIVYFVPCDHNERTARIFAKLLKKQYLRVYQAKFFDQGFEMMKSYKVVPVSQKQLFEMKLRGMINTENRERAVQAQEYLGIDWPMP